MAKFSHNWSTKWDTGQRVGAQGLEPQPAEPTSAGRPHLFRRVARDTPV